MSETKMAAPLLRLESDDDPGAAARLLDLLAAQRRWPVEFLMARSEGRTLFEARFGPGDGIGSPLVARLRQLPGMRQVDLVEPRP
jgi:hypothetical protein